MLALEEKMRGIFVFPDKIKKYLITKREKITIKRRLMLMKWKKKACEVFGMVHREEKSLNPKFTPLFCQIAVMI